jgi:diguanylate cyclase (GGDEF)-like protein
MAKRKETTLIEGSNIACNRICQAIKDKGLPHNSIWIYISHLVHNVDSDPNLNKDQRLTIITLCNEYLGIIKDLSNPDHVHKQGLHLLAEISEIQQQKIRNLIKEEQQFSGGLLSAISKNLEKFYTTMHAQDASEAIVRFKNVTLKALQTARDKSTMLTLVEDGFDKVGEAVARNMATIKQSLDSMLDLESKAIIDPLTGIFNRRFFDQELPKIIRTFLDMEGHKPFSLLVLDIDNFKEVNDQYGHFIGDFAIQRVAEILQKNCRAGIDAPIRLGGDEFALFLIGAAKSVATHKAQTIREHIAAETFNFTQQDDSGQATKVSFPITVSIGVSELNYRWKDIDAQKLTDSSLACNPNNLEPHHKLTFKIAESADRALYEAKNQGKNKVSVYENEYSSTAIDQSR